MLKTADSHACCFSAKRRTFRASPWLSAGISLSVALLSGCSLFDDDDNDDNAATALLEIRVTNLTAAQPLSPAAVILHPSDWRPFTLGHSASLALEVLAEAGDNSDLLEAARTASAMSQATSGSGIIAPGDTQTVQLEVTAQKLGTLSLSVLSMLVNTNDGLTGLNSTSLATLTEDAPMQRVGLSYDAGTEDNSETAATIPGPAAEGGAREGFNTSRDDIQEFVSLHAGVVTSDDGLAGSILTAAHRWDHPSVLIEVERLR